MPVFRHDTKYVDTDADNARHKGDTDSLGDASVGSTIRVIQGKAITVFPQTLEVQIEPPCGKYIHGEANRRIPKKDFISLPDERRFDDSLRLTPEKFMDIVISISKERAEALALAADFRVSHLTLDARWQSTFQTKKDITREFRPLELNPEDKKGGVRVDKAKLASLDNNQYRKLIRALVMRLIPKAEEKIRSYPSHS